MSGGMLSGKCCAMPSWSAASIDTHHSPASRSTSYSDADSASEMPMSGGSSESETSELTVRPARRPAASATTTQTPVGQRRNNPPCSAPRSSTLLFYLNSVGTTLVVVQVRDLLVRGRVGVPVVGAGRRPFPHHVRRDARAEDRRAVLRAVAFRMRAVRVEAVTEDTRVRVRQEAVLTEPAGAVLRVERVDVEVAPEAVERCADGGRLEAEDRAAVVGVGAVEVVPLVPGPVGLDRQLGKRALPVGEVYL